MNTSNKGREVLRRMPARAAKKHLNLNESAMSMQESSKTRTCKKYRKLNLARARTNVKNPTTMFTAKQHNIHSKINSIAKWKSTTLKKLSIVEDTRPEMGRLRLMDNQAKLAITVLQTKRLTKSMVKQPKTRNMPVAPSSVKRSYKAVQVQASATSQPTKEITLAKKKPRKRRKAKRLTSPKKSKSTMNNVFSFAARRPPPPLVIHNVDMFVQSTRTSVDNSKSIEEMMKRSYSDKQLTMLRSKYFNIDRI